MSVTIDQTKLADSTKYQNFVIHEGGALIQSSECQPFRISSQDPNSRGLRYLVLEMYRTGTASKYNGQQEVSLGMTMRRWFSSDLWGFSEEEQEEVILEPMRLEIQQVYIQQQTVTVLLNLKIPQTGDQRMYKLSAAVYGGSVWGLILGRANP
ncbi:hypothetical protein SCHPADRAFT_945208 [Schizopora paradoxa]|uniref:Uncharacterized protein n=1 Tax=Schizopora paradoxa TaxID=27342 RepID=A0A0H2RDE7_9AGAM|nr:hypothetical protein SCHPADRAFT_945208 [Schizopora paradoxa]